MSGGCRGWVCQFKSKEMGELKTFFYPIRIKIWFLEENEVTPGPISVAELATEEPKEDMGSPESHLKVWMYIGLIGVTLVLVGLGIRKMYYCCKKAYNFGLDER